LTIVLYLWPKDKEKDGAEELELGRVALFRKEEFLSIIHK